MHRGFMIINLINETKTLKFILNLLTIKIARLLFLQFNEKFFKKKKEYL
jgi:hypothetical protein